MEQSSVLSEAVHLFKEGKNEQCAQLLRDLLKDIPDFVRILLGLSKSSNQPHEKIAAAELALALDPNNEMAKREVLVAHGESSESSTERQIDATRVTGMTRAQAGSVIWPFRGLGKPMGVLFEENNEGKITTQDLGYAIKTAKDLNVQRAARTLLLSFLLKDELKDPPLPLTVIEGSGYTAWRERRDRALSGLFLGIGLSLFLFGIILGAWALISFQIWPNVPVLLLFIASYPILNLCERFFDQSEQFKSGREAEQSVIDILRVTLTSPWTLIHNLEWADRRWGDVDLVLVGPGGVWAFEIKAYKFQTRNSGDRWEYRGKWGWRKLSKHPGAQARQNAKHVQEFLKSKNVFVRFVQPVVIWAGEDDLLELSDPETPVWKLSEVPERLEELWYEQRLSNELGEQCVDTLQSVVAQVKQKESGNTKKT